MKPFYIDMIEKLKITLIKKISNSYTALETHFIEGIKNVGWVTIR